MDPRSRGYSRPVAASTETKMIRPKDARGARRGAARRGCVQSTTRVPPLPRSRVPSPSPRRLGTCAVGGSLWAPLWLRAGLWVGPVCALGCAPRTMWRRPRPAGLGAGGRAAAHRRHRHSCANENRKNKQVVSRCRRARARQRPAPAPPPGELGRDVWMQGDFVSMIGGAGAGQLERCHPLPGAKRESGFYFRARIRMGCAVAGRTRRVVRSET